MILRRLNEWDTFEPASLRLDRGETGYKLKMSLFSCSAANTPHSKENRGRGKPSSFKILFVG